LVPPFYENKVLKKADKISSVTISQKYCIIGKLSLLDKKLTPENHQNILEYIPNAIFEQEKIPTQLKKPDLIEKSNFNIFWCSGYNQWTDYKTLCKGLEKAMDKNSRINFFSTQGCSKSKPSAQLKNFQKMIYSGPHSEKFHFTPCLSKKELRSFLRHCNLGLVCDKSNYETIIGARTMTNEMIKQELPLILSCSTELSQTIDENNLYPVFSPGNSQELAKKILQVAENPKKYRLKAANSYNFLFKKYNPKKTTKNLIKWLQNPSKKQRV
jgi:glycosyltransferase involved in cell wall biosynthesis